MRKKEGGEILQFENDDISRTSGDMGRVIGEDTVTTDDDGVNLAIYSSRGRARRVRVRAISGSPNLRAEGDCFSDYGETGSSWDSDTTVSSGS